MFISRRTISRYAEKSKEERTSPYLTPPLTGFLTGVFRREIFVEQSMYSDYVCVQFRSEMQPQSVKNYSFSISWVTV